MGQASLRKTYSSCTYHSEAIAKPEEISILRSQQPYLIAPGSPDTPGILHSGKGKQHII
jgi:hypothetical protein